MAVVIGTNLRKELAGGLLFDGVSFKVERRERLALSGPNGAGKTTLLRMLAGETGDRRRAARLRQGHARRAARPAAAARPRALAARVRARRARATCRRSRRSSAGSRQAMAAGDHGAGDDARATRRRRRGSSTRAATRWRENSLSTLRGLGFADDELDRQLRPFSGGELTRASLARALAGDPGPAAPRRADEPPRRRAARVARADARRARRRRDPRRARPLVPRGDRRPRCSSSRRGARRTSRASGTSGGARRRRALLDASKSIERYNADIARLAALRRPLPLQEVEGQAGAGEADAHRAAEGGAGGRLRRARAAHAALAGGSASSS